MSALTTTVLASMDPEIWYSMAQVTRRCGLKKVQVGPILARCAREGLAERKPRVGRPGYMYKSKQKNAPAIALPQPGEALHLLSR